MNTSTLERLGLGLLISAWLIFGVNFLGNTLVRVEAPAEGVITAAAPAKEETAAAPAAEPVDFAVLLQTGDAAAGEKVFGKCKSCHTVDKGGANRVGPNLWGVVGGPKAHIAGFGYSGTLAGMGGEWTYESLNKFLTNPKAYVAGTKMSFAGLADPKDRANVILFMRQNADTPAPLP